MSSDHRILPYPLPLVHRFYTRYILLLASLQLVLSPLYLLVPTNPSALYPYPYPHNLYMPRHNAFPPAASSRGIRASARDALTSLGVDSHRLHARADRILRYTSKTHAVYCRNALRGNSRSDDIEMVTAIYFLLPGDVSQIFNFRFSIAVVKWSLGRCPTVRHRVYGFNRRHPRHLRHPRSSHHIHSISLSSSFEDLERAAIPPTPTGHRCIATRNHFTKTKTPHSRPHRIP